MDCPSCARKIETAVSRVEGVQQAQVLFATEKLVVDLAPASPDPVTAAVLAAGFQLKGERSEHGSQRTGPQPADAEGQQPARQILAAPVARRIDGDGGPAAEPARSAALYPGHPLGVVAHLPARRGH